MGEHQRDSETKGKEWAGEGSEQEGKLTGLIQECLDLFSEIGGKIIRGGKF